MYNTSKDAKTYPVFKTLKNSISGELALRPLHYEVAILFICLLHLFFHFFICLFTLEDGSGSQASRGSIKGGDFLGSVLLTLVCSEFR